MDYVTRLFKDGINTSVIASDIRYYATLESTMDEVHSLAKDGVPEGLIVIAENQRAGRGRRGNVWVSESGNLLFSILLRPKPENVFLLQPLIAISLRKGIIEATGIDLELKWPNDLMVGGCKVGGILMESELRDTTLEYVVVGIGLNLGLSQIPQNLDYQVSDLNSFSAGQIDRSILLKSIIEAIDFHYNHIDNGTVIVDEWRNQLNIIGKYISVRWLDNVESGEVLYVDDEGAIGLRLSDGRIKTITTGDIVEVHK